MNNYTRNYNYSDSRMETVTRAFPRLMRSVYAWMCAGLLMTGFTALGIAKNGYLLQHDSVLGLDDSRDRARNLPYRPHPQDEFPDCCTVFRRICHPERRNDVSHLLYLYIVEHRTDILHLRRHIRGDVTRRTVRQEGFVGHRQDSDDGTYRSDHRHRREHFRGKQRAGYDSELCWRADICGADGIRRAAHKGDADRSCGCLWHRAAAETRTHGQSDNISRLHQSLPVSAPHFRRQKIGTVVLRRAG